ncbi:uncharacterized protein LOC117180236 [Belonocnema kinseyi]|uniref:uncharacterized protein LOC117180236 n=1 Tax=Belonocnema kinseyi TaxID=2817044 RepID=UPI00143DAD01|nr:uncharacterized protein LOC117180236 [Belonocnema kinseyi]XP_033228516.1 uncharacterized protein LOC117180236 [Belonocnema kinseyi]
MSLEIEEWLQNFEDLQNFLGEETSLKILNGERDTTVLSKEEDSQILCDEIDPKVLCDGKDSKIFSNKKKPKIFLQDNTNREFNKFNPFQSLQFSGRNPHPKRFIETFEYFAAHENLIDKEKKDYFIQCLVQEARKWLNTRNYGSYEEMKEAFLEFFWGPEVQKSFLFHLKHGKYNKASGVSTIDYFFMFVHEAKLLDDPYPEKVVIEYILHHFNSTEIEEVIKINPVKTIEEAVGLLRRVNIPIEPMDHTQANLYILEEINYQLSETKAFQDLKFSGFYDKCNPKTFIKNFESFATHENLSHCKKQHYFIQCLTGSAQEWLQARGYGTYEEMKEDFLNFYWSPHLQTCFLHYLKEGKYCEGCTKSKTDYFFNFYKNAICLDDPPPEKEIIKGILHHFNLKEIKDYIIEKPVETLKEAVGLLSRIDFVNQSAIHQGQNNFNIPQEKNDLLAREFNFFEKLKFCGHKDTKNPHRFIQNFEFLAENENLSEYQKQLYFSNCLDGEARRWLDTRGYGPYEEIKKDFLNFYWSPDVQRSIWIHLKNATFHRGYEHSWNDYFYLFYNYVKFFDNALPEKEIITDILHHFKLEEVESAMELMPAETLEQALNLVTMVSYFHRTGAHDNTHEKSETEKKEDDSKSGKILQEIQDLKMRSELGQIELIFFLSLFSFIAIFFSAFPLLFTLLLLLLNLYFFKSSIAFSPGQAMFIQNQKKMGEEIIQKLTQSIDF